MTRSIVTGPSVLIDTGGNKITNVADGVAASDAATVGQLSGGGGIPQGGPLTADLDADGFNIENVPVVENAGAINLNSTTSVVNVNAQSDLGLSSAAGGVGIFGELGISCNPSTGDFEIRQLAVGHAFVVYNSAGNPIFKVDENGDLHGKTGKALTFDL